MQQGSQKFLGVTPPISTTPSTEKEVKLTEELVETLRNFGQYESEEEAQKREVVLGKLNQLFKEFVRIVSLKRNLPESVANEAGGKIFTFGSYRLGVHGKGADIDTLCVSPKHVAREDFFLEMYEILKTQLEVTELTGVPDAYVPVIKFHFSDIPIDLVFARLALPSVPDELDLRDDNLLKNLDERCIRSLNGSRVTDEILRLVPNIESFRIALRCIKMWAKRRAIYSNVMGFFGGVAWAMLVARVCQLYPNAAAGAIVSKFFRIMQGWNWPQPVLLKPIEEGPLQVRVWNPKIYPQDKAHRMPVITPAYPSMCATHNVTASTQGVMTQEFQRAAAIADRIMVQKGKWAELFEKDDFFHRYKYYLQVIASSDSAERQLKWAGMVESRLRQLVMKLELVENLELAHPYIKGFERVTNCRNSDEAVDAAHGIFPPVREDKDQQPEQSAANAHENGTTDQNPSSDACVVHTTTFYIGLAIKPRDPTTNAPRKLDISWPTQEFTKMVKNWDKYDEKCMGLVVQYIKSSGLPPEVFGDGEPRPVKKRPKSVSRKDRSVPASGEKPAKKRRASSAVDPDTPMSSASDLPSEDQEGGRGIASGTASASSTPLGSLSPAQGKLNPEPPESKQPLVFGQGITVGSAAAVAAASGGSGIKISQSAMRKPEVSDNKPSQQSDSRPQMPTYASRVTASLPQTSIAFGTMPPKSITAGSPTNMMGQQRRSPPLPSSNSPQQMQGYSYGGMSGMGMGINAPIMKRNPEIKLRLVSQQQRQNGNGLQQAGGGMVA
ncbi:polynucleotide adenylyltransferase [Quaeritorhiza haematococci]|nr:polynucleotide adenylyltransferase [Quaeritorhiza haematococci]